MKNEELLIIPKETTYISEGCSDDFYTDYKCFTYT